MTHFLRDILRQPNELNRTIDFLSGVGWPALDAATSAIRGARHVYLTGIGSSWHAALCAATLFNLGAGPVYLYDAAELLEFAEFPPDSVVVVISRSGRSIEIVKLLAKAHESGAIVIAITNSAEGPLAQGAQIPLTSHGDSSNPRLLIVTLPDNLPAGPVNLGYHILSVDGHVVDDKLTFAVKPQQ